MFWSRGIIGRTAAVATAVMIAGAVSLGTAPTVSAASRTVDCSTNPGSESLSLAPGEVFSVTAANCRGFKVNSTQSGTTNTNLINMAFTPNLDSGASMASEFFTSLSVIPSEATPATATLTLTPDFPWAGPAYVFTLVYSVAPPTVTRDETPPPWYQSYARASADDGCLMGWNPSYAMWPNNGKGGWVCDRTLRYNNSTRMWDAN